MKVEKGAYKYVIVTEKYVFKLPKITKLLIFGCIGIFEELLIWITTRDKRLAPVVFGIPFILVIAKRAKILEISEWSQSKSHYIQHIVFAKIHVDSNHSRNFGVINESIVLVDYNYKATVTCIKKLREIYLFIKSLNRQQTHAEA